MALIFVDGFSHYSDPFLAEKWDVLADTGATVTQSASGVGRFGGGGVVFTVTALIAPRTGYIQKNYNGVSAIISGLAFKQGGTQLVEGGQLIAFVDSSTVQVAIWVMQSGQLKVMRALSPGLGIVTGANNFVELGTSTSAISSSSFDFLEFKIVHHPSAGSVEIKRNHAAFYTLTNVNTGISGVNNSSSVVVGGFNASSSVSRFQLFGTVTDFYLLNTVANPDDALDPVDFIGDRHWEPITPTADAFYTAWTPSTGVSHFALIDEVPPNTSDYNSTTTLNAKDSFDVSAPTGPTTASALLALTMYCQKTTGGSNAIKGLIRLAGADRLGTEFQVPSPWAFRQSFLASKPGGGAITLADIAAADLGYEKTI